MAVTVILLRGSLTRAGVTHWELSDPEVSVDMAGPGKEHLVRWPDGWVKVVKSKGAVVWRWTLGRQCFISAGLKP